MISICDINFEFSIGKALGQHRTGLKIYKVDKMDATSRFYYHLFALV